MHRHIQTVVGFRVNKFWVDTSNGIICLHDINECIQPTGCDLYIGIEKDRVFAAYVFVAFVVTFGESIILLNSTRWISGNHSLMKGTDHPWKHCQ